MNEDGSWTPVWQNERVDNNLNPRWKEVIIPITLICNGDLMRPLKIEIFDHEKSGKHVSMGQIETSVQALIESNGAAINVIEPEKQAKKGAKYVNSGTFHASNCYLQHNPTFADVSFKLYSLFVYFNMCVFLFSFALLFLYLLLPTIICIVHSLCN